MFIVRSPDQSVKTALHDVSCQMTATSDIIGSNVFNLNKYKRLLIIIFL